MNSNADIYTKLQRDHESVARLFEQLSATTTTDTQTRQDRLADLKHRLTQHSEAENEVFYAALRQHAETRSLMQESEQDHQRLETLLDELDRMAVSDPQWRAKLQGLKVVFDQHVRDEEGTVFARARTLLTETQARELGEQFEQAKGRTPVGSMRGAAAQYAPEATAQARDMGARVQHEAERLSGEARAKGRALLQDQQHIMADQVGGLAEALQHTAQHLQEQNRGVVAQYAGEAAQGLERFSQTLRERDINTIMGQVEDFARRQPAVFIGSAALLGFLAARFLKSSAEPRDDRSEGSPHEGSPYGRDMSRPEAPVGPGAPVDPAVASAGARPPAHTPTGYGRESTTIRGGN